MNLALLDSELFELPEIIEDKLTVPDEMAVVAFNARGNMLAAGCMNGAVAVFDFETHGEPRVVMRGHSGRCTSVSWTRSSRKILSSSVDGKLMVWDVLSSTAVQVIELGHEVLTAALHPRSRSLCLALVGSGGAGQVYLVPLQPATQPPVALMQPAESQEGGTSDPGGDAKSRRDALTTACFNREGTLVLVGTSRGGIHVISVETQQPVAVVQLPGGAAIKSIVLSRNGKSFVVNSNDRILRACSLDRICAGEKPQPRELQDVVNRVQWSHASFSSESEHVIGTANSATDHLIYIWDMHGHLVTILGQGNKVKDGAVHFACHPTRPILACCARSGAAYIWTKRYSENWSAFAPDFKELEENEEYAEKEDEFDIKPQDELKQLDDDEEELIDIVTIEQTELAHVPDADDDEEELLFLPTQPECESSETAANGRGANMDLMDVDAGSRGPKSRAAGKRKSMA